MGAIGVVQGEGQARVSIINFGSRYRRAPRETQDSPKETRGYPRATLGITQRAPQRPSRSPGALAQ